MLARFSIAWLMRWGSALEVEKQGFPDEVGARDSAGRNQTGVKGG
jgi:hypothetical protein